MQNGGTLLAATGKIYLNDSFMPAGSSAPSTITGLNVMGGGDALQAGDSVTLLRATTSLVGTPTNNNTVIQGYTGVRDGVTGSLQITFAF